MVAAQKRRNLLNVKVFANWHSAFEHRRDLVGAVKYIERLDLWIAA